MLDPGWRESFGGWDRAAWQEWLRAGGVTVSNSTSGSTNYSLPDVITPGGNSNLATSMSYNGSWEVTSVTGANGANATTTYDGYGRPQSSKIPDGCTADQDAPLRSRL